MGKPDEVRVEVPELVAAGAAVGGGCAGIRRPFSPRCLVALALAAGVLLSAIFWLPPFLTHRSGFVSDDPDCIHAKIQASFILQKPISLLATGAARLEYEIVEEIGIPNTKVSIISMHSLASENSTYVVFGFLPDPKNASISSPALSILRSTLMDLVLGQVNITLTSSVFGHPSSFELLKFPGGITVIPLWSASIWEIAQILFDFKLNNSIEEILKNIDSLKDELKFGLSLRSYENVYVKLMNVMGSTAAPPVIVEASVLSDVGSGSLLPDRMKQLAQVITGPDANNLGLNNSVFGKVKQVQLSSYLEHSISSLAPGPSPSISPSPSDGILYPEPPASLNHPTFSPPSPSPLNVHHRKPPCCDSHTSPPESPMTYAPAPKIVIQPPNAPGPSQRNTGPPVHHELIWPTPKVSPEPSSLPPASNYASSPVQDSGRRGRSSPAPLSSYISPSPLSESATFKFWEVKLTVLLGLLIFQLLCGSP